MSYTRIWVLILLGAFVSLENTMLAPVINKTRWLPTMGSSRLWLSLQNSICSTVANTNQYKNTILMKQ
jgi:hypothetical protein